MSLIHYLFLGHFEHDGEVVRFSKSPSERVYKPVVRQPLNRSAINAILREVTGANLDFPTDWQIWLKDGYLVCDKYTRNQGEIKFVTCMVKRTCCDLYDVSAHCEIKLEDWLAVMAAYAKS